MIKKYIIIVILSILASLYFFEGYLKFYYSNLDLITKSRIYKEETGKNYDKRSKVQVYSDLKKINSEVAVAIPPRVYVIESEKDIFPLSGISNSQTIHCNENGYFSIYESDKYGFNNPNEDWESDKIEYLLVGDSNTQGECVNRPHDITSVLRKVSNRASLNLGMSSTGPLMQHAALREYLDSRVNNILWMYFEQNDLGDLEDSMSSLILNKYVDDINYKQNLKKKQKRIDLISKKQIKQSMNYMIEREKRKKKYDLLRFVRLDRTKSFLSNIMNKPTDEKSKFTKFDEFKKILEISKNHANKHDAEIHFVYLPAYVNFSSKNYFDNSAHKIKIKAITHELGIHFIDIQKEVFDKEEYPLKLYPFELAGHFNIKGYEKIGLKIHELISNKNK